MLVSHLSTADTNWLLWHKMSVSKCEALFFVYEVAISTIVKSKSYNNFFWQGPIVSTPNSFKSRFCVVIHFLIIQQFLSTVSFLLVRPYTLFEINSTFCCNKSFCHFSYGFNKSTSLSEKLRTNLFLIKTSTTISFF